MRVCIDAQVVQTHASGNRLNHAAVAELQRSPEQAPPPDEDSEGSCVTHHNVSYNSLQSVWTRSRLTLDGHAQGGLEEVVRVLWASRHLLSGDWRQDLFAVRRERLVAEDDVIGW